jgi:uncharacterized protein YggL (DUF469 family)
LEQILHKGIQIKEKDKAMKKLIMFLIFILSANLMIGQTKDDSSLSKREKRKVKEEQQYQHIKELLQNKSFVLEANTLMDRYGNRAIVSPGINFVSVDSTEAFIQVGSINNIGPNGVGGVTAKGKISDWQIDENKKNNSFYIRMNVMSPIGIYDVSFSISPSGKATAQLTGLSAGQLTFDGNIVPWEQSIVYVGNHL